MPFTISVASVDRVQGTTAQYSVNLPHDLITNKGYKITVIMPCVDIATYALVYLGIRISSATKHESTPTIGNWIVPCSQVPNGINLQTQGTFYTDAIRSPLAISFLDQSGSTITELPPEHILTFVVEEL